MSRFLREEMQRATPYLPGEQPRNKDYVKLNTNESPFPPSPGVKRAVLSEYEKGLNLYPDPECLELRTALAGEYGVDVENVMVGNGSDEILDFCFEAFFGGGIPLLFPNITYGFYRVFAERYRLSYREISLNRDFTINIDDYIGKKANIVLANPNAPTGIALTPDDIEKIVGSNPDNIVVIDEAYVDFGAKSVSNLIGKYDNLVVVMTFSKSRSLAGARIGFALANADLINDLQTVRYSSNPYNVNRISLAAGTAAVKDSEYYKNNCKTIAENRDAFSKKLRRMGFTVLPSAANFVFAKHCSVPGGELYEKLKAAGILVRRFSSPEVEDYLRITIGTNAQLEVLLKKLSVILGE